MDTSNGLLASWESFGRGGGITTCRGVEPLRSPQPWGLRLRVATAVGVLVAWSNRKAVAISAALEYAGNRDRSLAGFGRSLLEVGLHGDHVVEVEPHEGVRSGEVQVELGLGGPGVGPGERPAEVGRLGRAFGAEVGVDERSVEVDRVGVGQDVGEVAHERTFTVPVDDRDDRGVDHDGHGAFAHIRSQTQAGLGQVDLERPFVGPLVVAGVGRVGQAVAVVVHAVVAELHPIRVGILVVVVAVLGLHEAVTVEVIFALVDLVDVAVAVVVFAVVADFGGTDVVVVVIVVAVVGVVHVAAGLIACNLDGGVHVAETVVVGVDPPVHGVHSVVFIDLAVAVVVRAVAVLVRAGVDTRVGVVAVVAAPIVAGGLAARLNGVAGVTVAVGVHVRVPGVCVHSVVFVDLAVAVVVDRVAVLVRAGVDGDVGVVAVGVVRDVPTGGTAGHVRAGCVSVAVTIGVGVELALDVLVHGPVAVVVHVVAGLGAVGVHAGVGVVAVPARFHGAGGLVALVDLGRVVAVAITVHVVEERGVGGGIHARTGIVVGEAVTVVVDPTVAHFRGAGVHVCVGIVAVIVAEHVALGLVALGDGDAARVAFSVAIGVRVVDLGIRGADIHAAIAVVVDLVADLGVAGERGGLGVVAVGVVGHVATGLRADDLGDVIVAVAIGVRIRVPGGRVGGILVDVAVAVVVHAVADFGGAWVGAGVGIVAVGGITHVPTGGIAGHVRAVHVAVAVTVAVAVPGELDILVDAAVAVVVDVVADLAGVRVDLPVAVVAVSHDRGVAGGLVTRVHRHIGDAVAVAVVVDVPSDRIGGVLVDGAGAVVVESVADLVGAGVDGGVGVVAILVVGDQVARSVTAILVQVRGVTVGVTVVVQVPELTIVDQAVAVVVDVVADLAGVGMHLGITVVAVQIVVHVTVEVLAGPLGLAEGGRAGIAVAVVVGVRVDLELQVVVDDAVAVVVHVVADLVGAGVDGRVVVVAVVHVDVAVAVGVGHDRIVRDGVVVVAIGVRDVDVAATQGHTHGQCQRQDEAEHGCSPRVGSWEGFSRCLACGQARETSGL